MSQHLSQPPYCSAAGAVDCGDKSRHYPQQSGKWVFNWEHGAVSSLTQSQKYVLTIPRPVSWDAAKPTVTNRNWELWVFFLDDGSWKKKGIPNHWSTAVLVFFSCTPATPDFTHTVTAEHSPRGKNRFLPVSNVTGLIWIYCQCKCSSWECRKNTHKRKHWIQVLYRGESKS